MKQRRNSGKSTLTDVANLAGVSTMTASRALREPEKVSSKLREKIEAAINELGYVTNIAASTLASSSSRLVAMLVPSLTTPGCAMISESLQTVLRPRGYDVLLAEDHYAGGTRQIEMLLSYNPAAVVQYHYDNSEENRRLLLNAGIPVVEIGGVMPAPIMMSVGANYGLAIKQLINALANKGFRHIALLCAAHQQIIHQQILSGWHSAMLSLNQSPHRVISSSLPPEFTTGEKLLPEILLNWPELDLLICTADEVACGVIAACQARGISVPAQLAVAGLGGGALSEICSPKLTTIAVPYREMGVLAGKHIWSALQGQEVEQAVTLSTQLSMRASTVHL
ncbi:LacI family DNA-binding transcriptional regulator [Acerihabitans sp. TG2]|uniref:LacI family DNA-binding transcriptional regulator n=1 Tax=Acerihabitans sp. TG2 TaxID=3096008 RepID=UPI002B23B187|nr:LacI family DNA-binding transcriptional regulator [Acerihabitans sp. TG2]MEA9391306.1 LacI family DNA-binding transcriptional regulator [Acerihabitans sp. TG2]